MANTNKTKAEILQELESIKGLLLEEDDIPILHTIDETHPPETIDEIYPPATDEAAPYVPTSNPAVISTLPTDPTLLDTTQTGIAQTDTARPVTKANGENPFLPQHIRERLRGNNPPPLFEYVTAKKIISATKNIANKINKPRQTLVDEVIHSVMPQIETELRQRLFAMSLEDLEKLLNDDDE